MQDQKAELLSRVARSARHRRIITALDLPTADQALELAGSLGLDGGFVKVGLELFSAAGPDVVRPPARRGKDVFLDLKYHDIPNTVASARETGRPARRFAVYDPRLGRSQRPDGRGRSPGR